MTQKKVKVAAIGDLHVRDTSAGAYHDLLTEISEKADVLALCGDLTDHGLIPEAEILRKELSICTIPIVAVLGNHDYENNNQEEIKNILTDANITMLESETFEFNSLGFAGIKGFCGGFDNHMLGSFGEPAIKNFVTEVINESLALENSLTSLRTSKKVVVMHYSPIAATVVGEPPEIFPFLGSSRLAEPIDRIGASVVFHGHSDYGTYEGKTLKEIPVYNVALPLLRRVKPDQTYALIEI